MADRKISKRSRRAKGRGAGPPGSEGNRAESAPPVAADGEPSSDAAAISEIAVREAGEIEGVAELTGGWRTTGVRVTEPEGENGGYVIDLRLAVEYGVDCVALAETIRSRIAGAIHRTAGRETRAVNVHFTGIRDKGLPEETHEEGAPLGEEQGIDF
ncbi:MAG: Asp23/Gls24 family envelope stress response protein [Planctomycetota bacterium]